jgi:hypothetical protein
MKWIWNGAERRTSSNKTGSELIKVSLRQQYRTSFLQLSHNRGSALGHVSIRGTSSGGGPTLDVDVILYSEGNPKQWEGPSILTRNAVKLLLNLFPGWKINDRGITQRTNAKFSQFVP